MIKKLSLTFALLLLIGCNVFNPAPELTWDYSPETVIIQATSGGGLEPEAAYRNRIPDAQVWGNGRYIWQTFNEDGVRQVWETQLSEDDMVALLQTFADKGFWRLKAHYEPKVEVYDSSSTSLRVNLLAESKQVSEYHSGAPQQFYALVGLVSSGAGAVGQPYVPQTGYITVYPLEAADYLKDREVPVWDAEKATTTLADLPDGRLEGPALVQAWAVVNQQYWSPIVVEGDTYYELHLEIPELTGRETP
jgi:hypothetical protein